MRLLTTTKREPTGSVSVAQWAVLAWAALCLLSAPRLTLAQGAPPAPDVTPAPAAALPDATTPAVVPQAPPPADVVPAATKPVAEAGQPAPAAVPQVVQAAPAAARKRWELGATLETHAMLIRNDLQGAANNKNMNFLYLYGRWEPTVHDALEIRTYIYQRLLADPGETGLRTDDTTLYYAHYFDLPQALKSRLFAAVTIPSSFVAQKMSLYTAPRVGGALSWSKGPYSIEAVSLAEAYIVQYREMQGGNPNPKYHWMALLTAEATLPKVPLTLGITGVIHRHWYYQVGAPPSSAGSFPGATLDPQFPAQPVQGSYGYQVFARWGLPQFSGLHSDLSVAYAQGDSTLGYTSTLHDGLAHTYLFWRTSSQAYAALGLRW